jgi:hypothetical protein
MDRLTYEQAGKLFEQLWPLANFMARLRMHAERVLRPDDPLMKAVMDADSAVQSLRMHVHYLSCRRGVGMVRPEQEDRS